MTTNGFHLINTFPLGVNYSGGAGASGMMSPTNGSVTFTDVDGIQYNNVFSSEYDNYMVLLNAVASTKTQIAVRLGNNGEFVTSDYSSQTFANYSSSYNIVQILAPSGSWVSNHVDTTANCTVMFFYGPYLNRTTAYRATAGSSWNSGRINDFAGTHSWSTSYNGFEIFAAYPITGRIAVYGMVK